MSNLNSTFWVTSAAVVFGVAGFAYFYIKRNRRLRNEKQAFDDVNIKIITTKSECDDFVSELRRRCQQQRVIGFDCEWVTNNGKRQPVALLQLSSSDGYCGLFRLCHLKPIPDSLKEILADNFIYKVGVAPLDDAKYLFMDYGITLNSTLDIRHLAHLCGYEAGGLASLSKSLLGVTLDKSWKIRCSDWEADNLSDAQIRYAAADARIAVQIFTKLSGDLNTNKLVSFLRRKYINWNKLEGLCSPYRDVHFRTRTNNTKKRKNKSEPKESQKTYMAAIRSRPLYHNCFLQAPDGELLCTCDMKKALWYVKKELADKVSEDPLTVRLRFEPAGRSVGDVGRFYQLSKENKCVVCGKTNSYIRKNVVPREYRKYFPDVMKDHSSHDIVLLCVPCHQRSNISDVTVRENLAAMCSAPLHNKERTKYTEDQTCKKIRSAARALLYQSCKHELPAARRQQLELVLLEHFPQYEHVTDELLKEASEVQVLIENMDYECHGRKVVEYFSGLEGGLLRLEQLWREHFLEYMCPKHLPDLWSVSHNKDRLLVRLQEGRLSEQDRKLVGL